MRTSPLRRLVIATGLALGIAAGAALTAQQSSTASGPKFQISFTAAAHSEPITGRVYVAISKVNDRTPIQQADSTGAPLFGKNIDALKPGTAAIIDASDLGH